MKKLIYCIISIILFLHTSNCSGYKPIFASSKLKFKIEDYQIKGEKRLGKIIYSKLYNSSGLNADDPSLQSVTLTIEVSREKIPTVKNNAGKILEYKINLKTVIVMNDFLTNKEILNQNYNYSASYDAQEQHSETVKLENINTANLVNKTYQNIILKISNIYSSQ